MLLLFCNRSDVGFSLCFQSLSLLHLVYDGDDVSEGEECSRRQDEDKHAVVCRYDGSSEDGAVAEQFSADAEQCESDGESETDANAVECRIKDVVLAGERFGSSENDTVDDDERYEKSERLVDVGQVCCDLELYYCYEGCNDDDIYGDVYHVGRQLLYERDDDVRAYQHCHGCQSHHHAVDSACRGGQCRTHSEHQYEGGVLLHDAVEYYSDFAPVVSFFKV